VRIPGEEFMRNKTNIKSLIVIITLTLLSIPFPGNTVARAQEDPERGQSENRDTRRTTEFIRGRLLVQFRNDAMSGTRANLIAEAGARDAGALPASDVHVIELPEGADERAMVNALQSRAEIEFAELDEIVPPADLIPNDPWYANWEWHLRKIQAPSAWSINTGSANVVIAVLDTGVDGAHADLSSKLISGWNVYDNNSDTRDVNGHGTLVAGVAAASSNNGMGVASVAWSCRIMPVRISDTNGFASFSSMASGLAWAADHGARVANLSYRASASSTVGAAAQYFLSRGGVVAVAAGNEGVFDSSPDNPYLLTVGGTDSNDLLYAWSNTGNNLDLVAPGSAYTTVKGGGYSAASGTSIAAPIVAGLAALVVSANPNLTGDEVQTILKQSTDELGAPGWDSSFGWGRVNATRALETASEAPGDSTAPEVSFLAPGSGETLSGTVSVLVGATDNVSVASVTLGLDGAIVGSDNTAPYTFSWDTLTSGNGAHILSASAVDAAGNSRSVSIAMSVSNTPDQTPPTISITSPTNGARVSGTVTVLLSATDNVGVTRVDLYVDGVIAATSTSAPFTFRWNTKKVRAGAHTLQCKAYDRAGNIGNSANCTVYR
jgi:thermitase